MKSRVWFRPPCRVWEILWLVLCVRLPHHPPPTQRLEQVGVELGVALGVGVDLVGFKLVVAENAAPAVFQQGQLQVFGDATVHGVVAGQPGGGQCAEAGYGNQYDLRAALLALGADLADVGFSGAVWLAAQKVVAANADDDERGPVAGKQVGQAGEGLGAGVARYAGVDDVPPRGCGQ